MSSQKTNEKPFFEKPIFINFVLFTVNFGLFISKIIFSYLTNSRALQADAFDNLTDLVLVFAALVGIILANKKPSEEFPYGYYKIENIISLIISIVIFYTAYNIIRQSIVDIIQFINGTERPLLLSFPVFIFLIISLIISLIVAIYMRIVANRIKSPIIKSEASEKWFDIFISLSVLIGFLGALINLNILDSIFGILISLFIIRGGYGIFLNSTKTLLDAVIDFEKRTELHELIEEFSRVKRIERLDLRAYGKYIFLELEVVVSHRLSSSDMDTLKKRLNEEIKENFPKIFKTIIITESEEKSLTKIAVPLEENEDLDSKIFDKYGEAPYFAIFTLEEGNLTHQDFLKNKFIDREKRKGILISDWLTGKKIDKIYVQKELNKGPRLVFTNSMTKMVVTDKKTVKEIVDKERELTKNT
ncbi:MAG: cation diffusion facilitator family transporter [Promethearchaeia archaeon]